MGQTSSDKVITNQKEIDWKVDHVSNSEIEIISLAPVTQPNLARK